jgi:hypothetical protein
VESDDFEDTLIQQISTQFSNDLEELAMQSDTGSSTPLYGSSRRRWLLYDDLMMSGALPVHVSLDVRARRLCVVRVANQTVVVCTEYAVQSQDAALELFAYIEKHRNRFASVRIS